MLDTITVVHCSTASDWKKMLRLYPSFERSAAAKTYWDVYKDQTCFRLDYEYHRIVFASVDFYISRGYNVISIEEFLTRIKEEL